MKPEPGVISEDAFRNEWGAHIRLDGDFFSFREVYDLDMHTVWTVVETGEANQSLYACAGFHIVNVIGYCVTTKPWADLNQPDAYWYFDDRDTYMAVLADGDEVEEVGWDEDDARERIEDIYEQRVMSIEEAR